MKEPKTTHIAAAILVFSDGHLVFQRRSKDAPVAPGKLGFFGGEIEQGETPEAAIERELKEEISLPINPQNLYKNGEFELPKEIAGNDKIVFHLYRMAIDTLEFEVYEGDGAEAYMMDDLLKRKDVAASTKYLVEKVRHMYGISNYGA